MMSQDSSSLGRNVHKTPGSQATGSDTDRILQTEALTKDFGGIKAVDDVAFSITEGERRCLIGPNGAGKSTLINLITGQLKPTAGRVYFDGADITETDSYERINAGMSLKFQSPNVYNKLTVRSNLRIPLQRRQEPTTDRLVDLLDRVNLGEDLLEERADSLSHGQQQHLEIAMALALEPKLLLLDEPVAGLSSEEQQRVAELVRSLNDDGITFVIIEHDIDFVEAVAEKVTVMHNGALFREGSIEEIQADSEVRRIYLGGEA